MPWIGERVQEGVEAAQGRRHQRQRQERRQQDADPGFEQRPEEGDREDELDGPDDCLLYTSDAADE